MKESKKINSRWSILSFLWLFYSMLGPTRKKYFLFGLLLTVIVVSNVSYRLIFLWSYSWYIKSCLWICVMCNVWWHEEQTPSRLSVTLLKKVCHFPVPCRDVTYHALPGREYFNYSRLGRVWYLTSRLGTGKSLTFFYSVYAWQG